MDAREIAEKFAGQVVDCVVTRSRAPNSAQWTQTRGGRGYKARIIGWKDEGPDGMVAVELINGKTNFTVQQLDAAGGYTWLVDDVPWDEWGKKIYPEEVVIPALAPARPAKPGAPSQPGARFTQPGWTPRQNMPEFPHTCRDCGSPSLNMGLSIDCSNPSCRHKYKSKSAQDLFLPENLRQAAK